jgi:hypothetical protein
VAEALAGARRIYYCLTPKIERLVVKIKRLVPYYMSAVRKERSLPKGARNGIKLTFGLGRGVAANRPRDRREPSTHRRTDPDGMELHDKGLRRKFLPICDRSHCP